MTLLCKKVFMDCEVPEMSKFSLDVLQRRVFPFAQSDDPDIILGPAFGEDVALTRIGGDILVSHVDPIVGVGAIGNIGWLAVRGGILETLLEIAFVSKVCMEVEFSWLPIPLSYPASPRHFDSIRCG